MTQLTNQYSFRDLPSVDKLLSSPFFEALLSDYGHSLVSQTVRDMLNDLRQQIRHQAPVGIDLKADDSINQFAELTKQRLQQGSQSALRSVFNLTGIVLHTNLGRALLPDEAVEAVVVATN